MSLEAMQNQTFVSLESNKQTVKTKPKEQTKELCSQSSSKLHSSKQPNSFSRSEVKEES